MLLTLLVFTMRGKLWADRGLRVASQPSQEDLEDAAVWENHLAKLVMHC